VKSREVRSVRAVNLLNQNWKEIPLRRLTILFALVAVFGGDLSFAQVQNDYTMPASGVVTVVAEGGLIFQAKINGQGPFKLLFDTGSSNLLNASFARHLGLPLEGNVKIGAGGGTLEGQTAHVDRLQIGDLVLRNQTFYVIDVPWDPSDPQVGAIGYEVMMRLAVKIDFEEQKLTFYREPPVQILGHGG
jgi:Aspartyl protease